MMLYPNPDTPEWRATVDDIVEMFKRPRPTAKPEADELEALYSLPPADQAAE
jgi:hypothetical protein